MYNKYHIRYDVLLPFALGYSFRSRQDADKFKKNQ